MPTDSRTAQGLEGDRAFGAPAALCRPNTRCHPDFIGIDIRHHRIGAWRGVKDPVVIEVPFIADVGLIRLQGRGQGDVDSISARTFLAYDTRAQGRGDPGEDRGSGQPNYEETENGGPDEFDLFRIHTAFFSSLVFLKRGLSAPDAVVRIA